MLKKITAKHTPFSVFAWIISIIFHPVVYATFGSAVLLWMLPEYYFLHAAVKRQFIVSICMMTYVLPLLVFPIYYVMLQLLNTSVREPHVRLFLLFTTTCIYIFTYKKLFVHSLFAPIHTYILLCATLLFLSFLITFFWRISLHMIGIGGFIGLLFSLLKITYIYNELLFVLAVAVAGVVAYSRLLLQAHSQSQVYVGFLLGFIVSVVFLYLFPI